MYHMPQLYVQDAHKITDNLYEAPPYGRNWGQPHLGYNPEPLWYDPRDPAGGHYRPQTHTDSDEAKWRANNPTRGAAYLPRPRHTLDPLHPAFGYVPVNYNHPNDHPFHLGAAVGPQVHTDMIPTQVPFPVSVGLAGRTLYRARYYPGVAEGVAPGTRLNFGVIGRGGIVQHMSPATFPTPQHRYKVTPVDWFNDQVQGWPQKNKDTYVSIPFKPPPPPPV